MKTLPDRPCRPCGVLLVGINPSPVFRATGERYLIAGEERRVTDGLRCRACGRAAVVVVELMDVLSGAARPGETLVVQAG